MTPFFRRRFLRRAGCGVNHEPEAAAGYSGSLSFSSDLSPTGVLSVSFKKAQSCFAVAAVYGIGLALLRGSNWFQVLACSTLRSI